MEIKLDLTRLKTPILDVINYNILNSTALYDYNIRSYEQKKQLR
jgi:phosphinothricin acetyltransferase